MYINQKLNMKALRLITLFLSAIALSASAQSYFDDDIYFDPAKASKKKPKVEKVDRYSDDPGYYYYTPVADYKPADSYSVSGTRSISVDAYNRRGVFAPDSLSTDSAATDFQYTRRIEQFYNPEVVTGSKDKELAQIYYAEPQTVNVYVNTPSSFWGYDNFYPYSSYYNPYFYNPSWRWGSSWYWSSWYDPYWSWNWGWGPSWDWGWGPSYGWGWGPSYGWGWGHHHHGWGSSWCPSWDWGPGPSNRYDPRHPGAGNRRPGATAGTSHSGQSSYRPGYGTNGGRHVSAGGNYRPGYSGSQATRPGYGTSGNSNYRPGYGTNGNRHQGASSQSSNYRPNYGSQPSSTGRPAYGSGSSNSSRPSYTNSNSNSNSSRPSYNSSSSSRPSYNSGSSYSGGSRSSGSSYSGGGGSSRSSGGGRGRH